MLPPGVIPIILMITFILGIVIPFAFGFLVIQCFFYLRNDLVRRKWRVSFLTGIVFTILWDIALWIKISATEPSMEEVWDYWRFPIFSLLDFGLAIIWIRLVILDQKRNAHSVYHTLRSGYQRGRNTLTAELDKRPWYLKLVSACGSWVLAIIQHEKTPHEHRRDDLERNGKLIETNADNQGREPTIRDDHTT